MTTIAERITRAIHDGDPHLAHYIAAHTKSAELREAVLELAAKVPLESIEVGVDDILDSAARAFGINREDILSANRRHEVVKARQVACYAAHLLGHSQSHVARCIGRDHTTVWNAVQRVGETAALRGTAQKIAQSLGWDRNALEAS